MTAYGCQGLSAEWNGAHLGARKSQVPNPEEPLPSSVTWENSQSLSEPQVCGL